MTDAGEHLAKHMEDYTEKDYETAEKVKQPVIIAKIDCVSHQELCNVQEDIRAYPTLRLFVDGEPWRGGDYHGHRTILEMVEWLFFVEEQHRERLEKSGALGETTRKLHQAHASK